MKILGISAYYHDSAACISIDGAIVAAAQEERFTRLKHDSSFPYKATTYCLNYCGLSIDDLDAVVYYEKPFLKFERLIETYYAHAPAGLMSFIKAIPLWTREKLFIKDNLRKALKEVMPYNRKKLRLLFTDHHLSHAASAFFPSAFYEAAILTLDGAGEWATASLGIGKNNSISILKELHFPNSIGLLYSAFTAYLGFMVNSGEYKLMGLAPYGNPESPDTADYIEKIKSFLLSIHADGSVQLHQKYFGYATGLRMYHEKRWKQLFGFGPRKPNEEIMQHHCNLAYAIQSVTEDVMLLMAAEAKRLSSCENLVLAGGVALNCVANGKILKSGLFQDIFIQPASGDAGGALGAALATEYIYYRTKRTVQQPDAMSGALLGPSFTDVQVESCLKKYGAIYRKADNLNTLADELAQCINNGMVVGWFQGRMEFGPRALGNRSFLADARNIEMQKQLNLKIKFREGFRPFAPVVIADDSHEYFDIGVASPYMLLVAQLREKHRITLPDNYSEMGYMQKLYTSRSNLQAITHCDFSARLQTVHDDINPELHSLMQAFKKLTGCSVMVNTSFNVRGEPIVCSPDDAFRCFMRTETDVLVMNRFIIFKKDLGSLSESFDFNETFKAD